MFSILLRAPRWRFHQTASRAETELLWRARLGEHEAIALLLNRHRDRIFRLAFQVLRDRETAEDATQEVFLRVFQRLPHFRGESEFSTWLHRLTLNFCIERRRVQIRRDVLAENCAPEAEGDSSIARRVETSQLLEIALEDLGEGLRVALILREWQGLSYEEIAEILHLPLGTVRSRLHEARRRFQAKWLELGGEEL